MRRVTLWMPLGFAVTVLAGCSQANFGSDKPGSRQGDVLPVKTTGGLQNARKTPLDISKVPNNVDLAETGGPKPGPGAVVVRTAALECDTQTGAVIDVGPSGVQKSGSNLLGAPGVPVPVAIGKDGTPLPGLPGGPSFPNLPDLPTVPPVTVTANAKVEMTLKGKFCPEVKNRLTILFVIDYSGSMGRHFDPTRRADLPGNDPLVNGSCGRLRAAQALLNKIKSEKAAKDEVVVGMVPFAGGILTDRIVNIKSLDEFAATASVESLCAFVVQDPRQVGQAGYPGGVTSAGVDSSTNYQAAFTAAQSLLQGVAGKKQLYFVSDGEPTSPGTDPTTAGINAGASLRQNVDNLIMNALILGNVPTAQNVLERVVGSQRVRTADTADQLADKILDFPAPSIDENTGRATLAVVPYNPANLGLQSLVKDPAGPIWSWETQPFYLVGKPGEEVINDVVVTAQGRDGSTYKSQVRIRYRP
jgi:hypothetical protein